MYTYIPHLQWISMIPFGRLMIVPETCLGPMRAYREKEKKCGRSAMASSEAAVVPTTRRATVETPIPVGNRAPVVEEISPEISVEISLQPNGRTSPERSLRIALYLLKETVNVSALFLSCCCCKIFTRS